MMSGQLEKMGSVPVRIWWGLGAVAIFAVLLAALVHVLNDQVSQAQARQSQHLAAKAALSACAANHAGPARSLCIAQLNAGPAANFVQLADVELHPGVQRKIPGLFAGQIPDREPAGLAPASLGEPAAVY